MPSNKSIKKNIASSAMGSVGSKVVALIGFVVMARMLTPTEYGLMAVITVLISLSHIFVDLGLSAALVQNQKADNKHHDVVFLTHILLGLACTLMMLTLSGVIENFFAMEGLEKLSKVCAWLFVIYAVAFVPIAILEKNHRFSDVARVELYSVLFSNSVAIFLAWQGYGVWALVANLYCMSIVRAAFALYLSGWLPMLSFNKFLLIEMWQYSRYLFGMQVFGYIVANLDKLLIAKYLDAHALGIYRNADRIAQLPSSVVSNVFNRVLFSAFSSYQDDKERIRYQYLKAIRLVSFIMFPLMLGLSAISDYVVLAFLGDRWSAMSMILSLLALSLLFSTIGTLNINIYKALGKTRELFVVSIFLRLNLLFGIVVGIKFGMIGLLLGLIYARIVNVLPAFLISGRLIGVKLSDIVCCVYRVLICSGLMLATIYAGENVLELSSGNLYSLIAITVLGIISYGLFSLLFQNKVCGEILEMAKLRSF